MERAYKEYKEYKTITKTYNNSHEKGTVFVSIINTVNRENGEIYKIFQSEQVLNPPLEVSGVITIIYEVHKNENERE